MAGAPGLDAKLPRCVAGRQVTPAKCAIILLVGRRSMPSTLAHLGGEIDLQPGSQAPAWEPLSSKLCFVDLQETRPLSNLVECPNTCANLRNGACGEKLSAPIPSVDPRMMVAVLAALAKQSLADRRSQAELGNETNRRSRPKVDGIGLMA